ncbi:MAG TPA: ATP-binding protein [Anaerolineaceae bacterium]
MSAQKYTSAAVNLDHLYEISRIVTQTSEWKPALNEIVTLVRTIFIFDNLVVYLADPARHDLDVMYARAMGRGRSAEADIAWGESIANQIMDDPKTILQEPVNDPSISRLERPYILGIPLQVATRTLGAIVFIRFGSPPFEPEAIRLGEFIAQQTALLVERQNLQFAYDSLEQQNQEARLQEDFISTITHELRTPLGFIKGYTTTLLRSDTNWDAETQQEFLRIIDQEADRLQELIENLLDSARLQSGNLKMEFQAVRVDTLLKSVADRVKMHHPDMKVIVEPEKQGMLIRGDPKRLGQVFENILNNAVKYAPGSDVWVKIEPKENEGILIHIEDHGPGIPQRYLPHIFDRFFRNPELEPYVHGSGLGLFICKKIIQAHQGQIYATSIVGQGTTFHIRLPLQP